MWSVAENLDLVLDIVSEHPPMELPISDVDGCVPAQDILGMDSITSGEQVKVIGGRGELS